MVVACGSVSPSPRLLGYVISYLQGTNQNDYFEIMDNLLIINEWIEAARYPDIIGELATQSRTNLANTRSTDRERTQPPSLFELDCTMVPLNFIIIQQ